MERGGPTCEMDAAITGALGSVRTNCGVTMNMFAGNVGVPTKEGSAQSTGVTVTASLLLISKSTNKLKLLSVI